MTGPGSPGGRRGEREALLAGPGLATPPSRQIVLRWPRWRGRSCRRRNSFKRSDSSHSSLDRAGKTYVERSVSWYVQSAPSRRHAAHAGRALSHLVRRKRQVRQALVARFRGYVVAAREGRRFWEAAVLSSTTTTRREVNSAGTVLLGRPAVTLRGARGGAECPDSDSALFRCAPYCREVCMDSMIHRARVTSYNSAA